MGVKRDRVLGSISSDGTGPSPRSLRVPENPKDAASRFAAALSDAAALHAVNLTLRRGGERVVVHGGHVAAGELPTPPGKDGPWGAAFQRLQSLLASAARLTPHHGLVVEVDLRAGTGTVQRVWGFSEEGPPPVESVAWTDSPEVVASPPPGYPAEDWRAFLSTLRSWKEDGAFDFAELFVRLERT